jgi:hypothetical protein
MSKVPRKPKIIVEEEKMTIDSLLSPFKQRESIDTIAIQYVISLLLPHAIELHSYSDFHCIIKTTIQDIMDAPIVNWKYNRPADLVRCEDIALDMKKSGKPVDTMLSMSFNKSIKSFEVIDGIHRYTALRHIYESTGASESGITKGGLFQSFIIINLKFNQSKDELSHWFQTLNKSISVSELYNGNSSKVKKDYIELLCSRYQLRYTTHFQASKKPNKPNINRDTFMNILNAVYDTLELTEENKERLEILLEDINEHISEHPPKKVTDAALQKCERTGCYLFLESEERLIELLTQS